MLTLSRRRPMIWLTGVLLAGQLSACSSWHPQSVSPRQLVVGDSTQRVRITRLNGPQLTVTNAHVRGDTLFGTLIPVDKNLSETLVAVPLNDVQAIALRQSDVGKSVITLVVVGVLVGGVYLLVALHSIANEN